jgi:hypothetical protein
MELLEHHFLTMITRDIHLFLNHKKQVVEILVPGGHRLQEVVTIWTPEQNQEKQKVMQHIDN